MHGAARRLIRSQGREYTVRNATGGEGRTTPDYSDDGTVVAVLERRSRPSVEDISSGEAVETDLELRAVVDGVTIRGKGDTDGQPTKLVHPDGRTFEAVTTYPEDSGVSVIPVVRD